MNDGKLEQIKGTRNVMVPSHSFYDDDLMVFCKGKMYGLSHIKNLFTRYVLASGQGVSTAKSSFFSGSNSPARKDQIDEFLSFNPGSLPFQLFRCANLQR